jgi:tRNA(His) guanylyltransferase
MDALGDRMKMYEQMEADRRLLPLLPIMARLDGKSFHTFTQGLARPFDRRMSDLMVETTKQLVTETSARIGYTQSDEISLIFYSSDVDSQVFFDGRVAKMTSVLAALCTAVFNRLLPHYLPEKSEALPLFDCRVWTVPTQEEAVNTLIWRELDATKNSISMAAQAYYTHDELHQKNGSEKQEMLFQKGINWNDYPAFFKRGTYVQRRTIMRNFNAAELTELPAKHHARTNPTLTVERNEVREVLMEPLARIANRVAVVFDNAEPLLAGEE